MSEKQEQEKLVIDDNKDVKSGIVSAVPLEPFVMNSSTKVHLTIKNISECPGIRVRFRSEDYINPTSIDIDIPPGTDKLVSINLVPLEKGERDCLVEFAPLYDADGSLIPGDAADPIVVNKFSYQAREPLTGGLTSQQRALLSNILKVASAALVFGGVLVAVIPDLRSILSDEFITAFLCVILIMQLPILGLYFLLTNRLPQA
jgi:hypothetical protein